MVLSERLVSCTQRRPLFYSHSQTTLVASHALPILSHTHTHTHTHTINKMINQQTLPDCPSDVTTRGAILYQNGFTGFQGPPGSGKSHFILCWSECWTEEQMTTLRLTSGAQTLVCDDWIGRDYTAIHWSEYSKRVAVLDAMLSLGHRFQTQTKGMPCEHNVVCQACSRQLESTPDAHSGVQCRRPIQYTLY